MRGNEYKKKFMIESVKNRFFGVDNIRKINKQKESQKFIMRFFLLIINIIILLAWFNNLNISGF